MARTTLATLLAAASVAGCAVDAPTATTTEAVISDGTTRYGTSGFLWQPPLVDTAVTTGTWNGSYGTRLTVDLVELLSCVLPTDVVHTFTAVQTVNGTQRYKVEFTDIAAVGLIDGGCYRVVANLDGAPLGFRDVVVSSVAGPPPAGFAKWGTGPAKKVIAFRLEELDPDGDGVLNHVDACDYDVASGDAIAIPGQTAIWRGDGNGEAQIPDGTTHDMIWTGTEAYAPGEVDQGFAFDGSSHTLVPTAIAGSTFTLQAWVKADAIQPRNYGVILLDGFNGTQIDWNAAGGYRFSFSDGTTLNRNFGPASTTDFVHLGIVNDQSAVSNQRLRLYYNGTLVFNGDSDPVSVYQMRLGTNRNVLRHFRGVIDDVRIWNRALTADEIATIYAQGTDGICR